VQILFDWLGNQITRRGLLVALFVVVLTVAGIAGAGRIRMETGLSTMVNADGEAYRRFEKLEANFGSSQAVLLVQGESLDDVIQPANLRALDTIAETFRDDERVLSVVNPADALRQALAQGAAAYVGSEAAAAAAEIAIQQPEYVRLALVDPDTGLMRESFEPLFPKGANAILVVTLKPGLEESEQIAVNNAIGEAVESAGFTGVDPLLTGFPAVSAALQESMISSLAITLTIALLLMLVALTLLFPVRGRAYWRWLSLLGVGFGVIYAFGFMGVIGQSLTIGSLAVFPILVGLGVDYAIQFHNRYDEELRRRRSLRVVLISTLRRIGLTTGLALIAVVLGALGLMTSPTPIIRDFAFTMMFSLTAAWMSAFLVVPTILYWRDRRRAPSDDANGQADVETSRYADLLYRFMETWLRRMARWAIRHPAIVLPVALAFTIFGFVVDGRIGVDTNEAEFLSKNLPAIQGIARLDEVTGGTSSLNIIVEADDVADPAVARWVDGLGPRLLEAFPRDIRQVSSYADDLHRAFGDAIPSSEEDIRGALDALPDSQRRSVVTDGYTAANVSLVLTELPTDRVNAFVEQLEEQLLDSPTGATVTVSGLPLIMAETFTGLTTDRLRVTFLCIAIILGGLLLLYRLNVVRALFATLPMVLVVGWASGFMWAAGINFSPLTATVGALIVGIGAEFGILVLSRYYEGLEQGMVPEDAMVDSVLHVGRAVLASGVTTMAGFAALLSALYFPIFQNFGLVSAVNIGFSTYSAIVVLPTLVVLVHGWWWRRTGSVAGYRPQTQDASSAPHDR